MSRLVVLDTNILVSAGISVDGPSAEIVRLAIRGELIVVTCPEIVSEYWDVFSRPKFSKFGFPPFWLEALLTLAHHVTQPPPSSGVPFLDQDDAVFYDLSLQYGAVLVTGNLKHFPPNRKSPVSVKSPREFLTQTLGPP